MAAYVYIVASGPRGTLYTGVTSDMARRAHEHRQGQVRGFTNRYGCKMLVWFETHDTMPAAIQREKSIKRYYRQWKINLIEETNPHWVDLYGTLNR